MKKSLIVLIVSLLFSLVVKGQVVFCPTGAVWKAVFTRTSFSSDPELETIVFTGTTLVGGEVVKELTHQRFFLETNFKKTESSYIKQIGDTVFVKNSRTSNSWQILYNFSAQPAETWTNSIIHGFSTINYTTIVNATQTVLINGESLKQLTVFQHNSNGIPNNFLCNITERLGADRFLFPFGGRSVTDGDKLIKNLCYSDNTFGNYTYGANNCEYPWTDLNQLIQNETDFSIYPSLFSDELHIKASDSKNLTIEIYDIAGVLVRNETLSNELLNVQNITPGIYFATIYAGQKALYHKKLIKTSSN